MERQIYGLQSDLVDRISPVPFPRVEIASWIDIFWERDAGFLGGGISFLIADHIADSGYDIAGKPNMVVSDLHTEYDFDYSPNPRRNPRESLSSILTLVATLNQSALHGQGTLLHIARANKNSYPYFERFVVGGLYYYCDQVGCLLNIPMALNDDEWTLFACHYPAQGLDNALNRFAVGEAVEEVSLRYFPERKVNRKNIFSPLSLRKAEV